MMVRFVGTVLGITIALASAQAQNPHPSVKEIFQRYDRNQDRRLASEEVVKSRYARQFARWDSDGDNRVSAEDIIKFRRRFGIAEDGSLLKRPDAPSRPGNLNRPGGLALPRIEQLPRVSRDLRPTAEAARNSAYILRTTEHQPTGDRYVVLTDHQSESCIESLRRLARHHDGMLVQVDDLAAIAAESSELKVLRGKLADAKYVAVAMRKESFRENSLLGLWELFSTIDDDPQIDVWPGLLLASNAESLAQLVQRSIDHEPLTKSQLKPMAISQVQRVSEMRSLQKAGILRQTFDKFGIQTPVVAVYGPQAIDAPKLPGENVWNLTTSNNQAFVKSFPAEIAESMDASSLWIFHGHGIPGMSCSVDVDALTDDVRGKILLTGSCFSAAPWQSDLPRMREAPSGYRVDQRDAFVIRAIDQGALVAFGHQRLSAGFPHLYPVLESWTKGQSVGQAYQQLINGLIELQQFESGDFVLSDSEMKSKRIRQNQLLYVVIGDPALRPMEALH